MRLTLVFALASGLAGLAGCVLVTYFPTSPSVGFSLMPIIIIATTIGGLGHTLPYLIPNFHLATVIAIAVVLVELWVIAFVRARYMDTPFWRAALQVVVGGSLVFAAGILIGNA